MPGSATLLGVALLASQLFAAPTPQSVSDTPKGTKKLSAWMIDSIRFRKQGAGISSKGSPIVSYEHGTFYHALLEANQVSPDPKYEAWIKAGLDQITTAEGNLTGGYKLSRYTLDDIRVGEALIKIHRSTKNPRYKTAADQLRSQLKTQPRTAEGGFWHKKRYPNQQWLDGLYMALPFYAQYAEAYEDSSKEVMDDIGKQFRLIWEHCLDKKTGLLRHGYDFSKKAEWADEDTGASPEVWDRALGWYMMALVDLLAPPSPIPKDHPTTALLVKQLQTLVPRLLEAADPKSGGWALVITQPLEREGNYIETSGTCMFVYSMLKAVRLGFVEDTDGAIVSAAAKAYSTVVENYIRANSDGTIRMENTVRVGSLDLAGDFKYYVGVPKVTNDLKGTAPFVMASLEFERLYIRKTERLYRP